MNKEKEEKIAEISARITEMIDFLGENANSFANKLGYQRAQTIYDIIKKKCAPSYDFFQRFASTEYSDIISIKWLLTGNGDMTKINTCPAKLSDNPNEGVPYYDVDFAAGFGDMMNDQTILPTNNIVFAPFRDATCWCNVTGHSMEPRINHGDIIALKECTVNDIQYGEIYAVVLDTFRTIKILRKSSDPDKFLLVPINKDYDEQEFDKSRILKIYGVMGAISKFF